MHRKAKSIRWEHHQNHLQTMFSLQMDQGRFCDVTLACEGGQTLKAHRAVLCAWSDYFDSVLPNLASGKDILIVMKDCKFNEVKLLIDFMYNGEINVEQQRLPSLLKTAQDLKINGLPEAIVQNQRHKVNETEQPTILPVDVLEHTDSSLKPSSEARKRRHSETRSTGFPIEASTSMQPEQVLLPLPDFKIELVEDWTENNGQRSPTTDNSHFSQLFEGGVVNEYDNAHSNQYDIPAQIHGSQIYESPAISNSNIDKTFHQEMEISRLQNEILQLTQEIRRDQPYFKFITREEYDSLRRLPDCSRNDSTFILNALKYIYKDSMKVLLNTTLTGRNKGETTPRRPMSPQKYNVLKYLFNERLNNMQIDEEERAKRISKRNLNMLISYSIRNIRRIN